MDKHIRSFAAGNRRVAFVRCCVCAIMLASLAACAGTPRDTEPGETAFNPTAKLRQLAAKEQDRPDIQLREVPPPPGVDPGVLAPSDSATETQNLPLDAAIERLAQGHQPPNAQQQGAVDLVAQTAALRHFVRGREAALNDRHLVAITEFNRALELDPDGGPVLTALARSHLAMGNQNRAAQAYERLLQLAPKDGEAQLSVAVAAANRRDYAKAAGIIAARRFTNESFEHDQGADLLASFTFAATLRQLGYDRAAIEAARELTSPQFHMIEQTRYAAQLNVAYRGQADLWRWVGDAHCRLGEYEHSLEAYQMAAGFASPDPTSLHPRVIYANLRLGRIYTAQRELLAALQSDPSSISERDILLCAYLFEHGQPVQHLSEAVTEMYDSYPDHSDLARAAASLVPADESARLLRTFVGRRPRDLHAVGQLLNWLATSDAPGNLQAAVQLTVDLIESHPDLAGEYSGRLFFAAPRPEQLVQAARLHANRSGATPAAASIEIRTLGLLGALGEAWSLVRKARTRWPADETLILLELDLAVMLEEPALVRQALADAPQLHSVNILLGLARTHRAVGDAGSAMHFAELAIQAIETDHVPASLKRRALLEQAHACVAFAAEQAGQSEMQQWSEEAAAVATRALEVEPQSDEVHEFLLSLYGPGGPLQNTDAFRTAAGRLFQSNPESRLYARLAAEEAINHGRFDQALERLVHLYDTDPSDTRSLRLAITTWVRQGRNDAALAWINERLESRPGDPALLEAWAELMVLMNRTDEALYVLERTGESDPDNHVARRLLESIYRSAGEPDKAFRLGEDRLLSRPRGVRRETELAAMYAGVGMQREAVDRIRWVVDRSDEATYDHLATIVAVLGRLEDATGETDRLTVEIVEHAIERYPESPLQLYGTGMRSLARLGSIDTRFDRIAELASLSAQGASGPTVQHALVWRELAQALINEGEAEAAARALHRRTLADVPTEPDALNALATFSIVADAAVDDGRAEMTLSLVHELGAQGRLPRLAGMQAAESIAAVLFHASQIFGLLGNNEGSEALLRAVIDYDAHNAMAKNNLGYQRLEEGHGDAETVAWIEHARELKSDDASILDTIGWLRYKQGILEGDDGALTLIQRSRDASEEPSAEVLDHLGDVQWRLGEHEAAIESWQQAAAMLDDPQERHRTEQNYFLLQTRGWGLLVADPAELYNRDIGARLERLQQKLQAVEQGEKPPVAETFTEVKSDKMMSD